MICMVAIPASRIRDRTFHLLKISLGAARTAVGQNWGLLLLVANNEDDTTLLLVMNLDGARTVG
jgi:hypothetical protein